MSEEKSSHAPTSNRLLVVISAPSGGGKTTLCNQLLAARPTMARAITCTTREPRGDEQYKYFDADAQAAMRETARACIENGRPWDLQLPMTTARGRRIWVRSVGQVERRDGKPYALVGALHSVYLLFVVVAVLGVAVAALLPGGRPSAEASSVTDRRGAESRPVAVAGD